MVVGDAYVFPGFLTPVLTTILLGDERCGGVPWVWIRIYPFPYDKIFDQTKSKAFADDKSNVTKMIISVFDRVENIVGKGEIACTSNVSFSHIVFERLLSQTRQKVSLGGNGVNPFPHNDTF